MTAAKALPERNFANSLGYQYGWWEGGTTGLIRVARGSPDRRLIENHRIGGQLSNHRKSDIDSARDDLMSHIHRCGVLKADSEHQMEWMDDTIDYLNETYPALTKEELGELKQIGVRFCQPVIPHGKGYSALTVEDNAAAAAASEGDDGEAEDSESRELAGV